MILNRIYLSPKNLFKKVIVFKPGVNIIYAHFDESSGKGESLHALGKSMLLDFILFALLVELKENTLHRLYTAFEKKILSGLFINLEFTVNQIEYKITRSFDNPNSDILFGEIGHLQSKFTRGNLKSELFKLIFHNPQYKGAQTPNWYYKLLSFFIKVKKRDDIFSDPIAFSRNLKELESVPFHLFLLNIVNDIPYHIQLLLNDISKTENIANNYQKSLENDPDIKSIQDLKNKRSKLQHQINKLDKAIKSYKFLDEYKELENTADEYTKQIKELWFQNSVFQKKVQELESLSDADTNYNQPNYVKSIYSQVNTLLANNAKKSLSDAVEFRKELLSSRKEFIEKESDRLNGKTYYNNLRIDELEEKRQKIFNKLSQLKALDDLKDIYSQQAQLQDKVSDINKSLKHLDDLQETIKFKITKYSNILDEIKHYLHSIEKDIQKHKTLLKSIFDKIFFLTSDVIIFDVYETDDNQRIKMSVLEGSLMDSSGKNQLRTLAYDLSVLLNITDKNLNFPRFIIHDGIFENLDKNHFYAFINFIESQIVNGEQFQYIFTLNDHNFLNEKENFKKDKILNNTVIELTPNSKLLGQNF